MVNNYNKYRCLIAALFIILLFTVTACKKVEADTLLSAPTEAVRTEPSPEQSLAPAEETGTEPSREPTYYPGIGEIVPDILGECNKNKEVLLSIGENAPKELKKYEGHMIYPPERHEDTINYCNEVAIKTGESISNNTCIC